MLMVLGSVPRTAEKEAANKEGRELSASHPDAQEGRAHGEPTNGFPILGRQPHTPIRCPMPSKQRPCPTCSSTHTLTPSPYPVSTAENANSLVSRKQSWSANRSVRWKQTRTVDPTWGEGKGHGRKVPSSTDWSMTRHSDFTFELRAQSSKQEIPKVSFLQTLSEK